MCIWKCNKTIENAAEDVTGGGTHNTRAVFCSVGEAKFEVTTHGSLVVF